MSEQLALEVEPPLVVYVRANTGEVIDVIHESELSTGNPLNEAVLWGYIALKRWERDHD